MRTRSVAGTRWRKSSRSSGAQNCVEVAHDGVGMAMRDSKNPDHGVLVLSAASWQNLLSTLRADDVDR